MALNLHFELRLEERQPERVYVSVVLAPAVPGLASVQGVTVQLHHRAGEPLGTQLLLPIHGDLGQPMVSTVELRSRAPIPPGAVVVGTAWKGNEQIEATCPCDPGTELQVHMRGDRVVAMAPTSDVLLELSCDERIRMARAFPWIELAPCRRSPPESTVMESEPVEPQVSTDADFDTDGVAAEFDLSDEDAAFLKDLMGEP
ncbi:MAG: hypothetical protein GWP91_10085 [Rhodobacterales bacterium]|nr:hypothetical protein [Rhodobacterales bacterium]